MEIVKAGFWICGADYCIKGEEFCRPHDVSGDNICYRCASYKDRCFTQAHEYNCTSWCKDELVRSIRDELEQSIGGKGDAYKLPFITACPSLLLILIIVTIMLVLTCRKHRKMLMKHPKDEEEMSSVTASSADIGAKTESVRNAPDKASADSESENEETMRKEPVANKPDKRKEEAKGSNPAVFNNNIVINVGGTSEVKTNDDNNGAKPKQKQTETTICVQETESEVDKRPYQTERALQPREDDPTVLQPVDDDPGEKAVLLDMPFAGPILSKQLSNHQEEETIGKGKID